MTSNYLPPWQKYLNPKLVNRLNKLLTKPGIINNEMARKIIERSPDLIDRLPLLAQQMQRWSTTIELNSKSIPILYVQNQDQKSQTVETQTSNYSSSSSDTVPVKKQLPVVKAKVVPVKETSWENQRTQPTELVLKTDNSLPNLAQNITSQQESPATDFSPNKTSISNALISSNPITPTSNISDIPIQRKLDTESSSGLTLPVVKVNANKLPENTSLNLNSENPVVYQLSQPTISETIPQQPLVNVESLSSSEIPIQRKLDTESSSGVTLPVVKVNANKLPENTSLNLNSENPVVYQLSQPTISETIPQQPLVNVESLSSSEIPIQRKLDTESSSGVTLPVVKVNANKLPENISLNVNSEIPVVRQLSQPTISETIPQQPLVNVESLSSSEIPIQRKLDTESSSGVTLPVMKVNANKLPENTSLNLNSENPVVHQLSQPTISETIPQQPLVNVESLSSSEIPIQRKLDTESSSGVTLPVVKVNANKLPENISLNLNSENPVVHQLSQPTIAETTPQQPLVNVESLSSSEIPIQRKLDTESSSGLTLPVVKVNANKLPENTSLNLNSENPVVHQLSQPTISETIPQQPLVNVESLSSSGLTLPVVKVNANKLPENTSLNLNLENPVVHQLSQPTISETIPQQPLVNVESLSSSGLTLPVVKVNANKLPENTSLNLNSENPVVHQLSQPTISETTPQQPLVNVESLSSSEIPIQRKLDTESSSGLTLPVVKVNANKLPENTSLNLNSENPVVHQLSQPTISKTIQQQPLVNVESLSPHINNRNSPSNSTTPNQQKLENKNTGKNTVVVYSQPRSSKSNLNESMLLSKEVKQKKPLVVTEQVENITQADLPVVQVNSESYLLEYEPLVLSNSSITKQKANNLNNSQLTHQTNLMPTANYNGTSSTYQQTSITNSIPSNQTTITSTSSINSQPPPVNQSTQTSIAGVSLPPQIDVDALVEKVERKIMRRLVVESERRGKRKWH